MRPPSPLAPFKGTSSASTPNTAETYKDTPCADVQEFRERCAGTDLRVNSAPPGTEASKAANGINPVSLRDLGSVTPCAMKQFEFTCKAVKSSNLQVALLLVQ